MLTFRLSVLTSDWLKQQKLTKLNKAGLQKRPFGAPQKIITMIAMCKGFDRGDKQS